MPTATHGASQPLGRHEKGEHLFLCPIDGVVPQAVISVICNRCDSRNVKKVGDMYVCPECMKSTAHPFECRLCGSKKVSYVAVAQASRA